MKAMGPVCSSRLSRRTCIQLDPLSSKDSSNWHHGNLMIQCKIRLILKISQKAHTENMHLTMKHQVSVDVCIFRIPQHPTAPVDGPKFYHSCKSTLLSHTWVKLYYGLYWWDLNIPRQRLGFVADPIAPRIWARHDIWSSYQCLPRQPHIAT